MSSLTRLRCTSTPTLSLTRFSTLALSATWASRSSSSKWIRSTFSSGTSNRTSGGPARSSSSRRSYFRYSRSESVSWCSACSAGRAPFPPLLLRRRLVADPFPLPVEALLPRRPPERCDVVVLCAITASSSALLRRAALRLAALPEILQSLLGALPDALNALLGALPEALDTLLGASPKTLDALLRAAADAGNAPSGTATDVLNGALGALASASHGVAGVGQQIVGSATDVAQGLADALEQLRVPVKRGEDATEDLRDVAQAGLEQRLGLDALNLELYLPEPDSSAGTYLDEVPGLREHGEVGAQIVQLELDLVDVDDRSVDVDVDRLVDLAWIDDRIVGQLLLGALGARRRPAVAAARL